MKKGWEGGFLPFHFVKLAALTSLIKEKYYRNESVILMVQRWGFRHFRKSSIKGANLNLI